MNPIVNLKSLKKTFDLLGKAKQNVSLWENIFCSKLVREHFFYFLVTHFYNPSTFPGILGYHFDGMTRTLGVRSVWRQEKVIIPDFLRYSFFNTPGSSGTWGCHTREVMPAIEFGKITSIPEYLLEH